MLRELTNSIKAILYERAVSPLSGVIFIVWVGFNWKPLAVLFWGADDVTARIAYIDAHYVDAWRNLYYPVILSAAVLIIYPFVALLAFALWEKVASWKLKLKQKFEGTVALPVTKSLAIWTEMREKDKQFNLAFEAKDNRITELEKQSGDLSKELNNLKESLSKGSNLEVEIAKRTAQLAQVEAAFRDEIEKRNKKDQERGKILEKREAEIAKLQDQINVLAVDAPKPQRLDKEELKLLLIIADAEEKNMLVDETVAIKKAGLTKVDGTYYMDNLRSKNFIYSEMDDDGSESIMLKQPGRAYLVQLKRNKKAPSKAPPPINPGKS
jgi:membrane-associated HD superfamily phosphohydrolase